MAVHFICRKKVVRTNYHFMKNIKGDRNHEPSVEVFIETVGRLSGGVIIY